MAGRFCWHLQHPCGRLQAVSYCKLIVLLFLIFESFQDDSACHVSEEVTGTYFALYVDLHSLLNVTFTAGAAHAAPLAILIGVAGTAGLGWILLIAASFATKSVPDLLSTTLPLQMGQ